MLTKLNKLEVINFIAGSADIFYLFDKVYIFGSILSQDKYSNDVDILLLYSAFCSTIQRSVYEIIGYIEQETRYPVDITALSFEEEKELNFIGRLGEQYICIK